VVLPQALPVIIPPTITQFLNLAKNSSLAVAIGYPDLISVSNTTLNQTGQAIEVLTLAMVVYLAMSLAVSLAMDRCNRAVAVPGRTGTPGAQVAGRS
jgi:general L-amino acid transport system permease protein